MTYPAKRCTTLTLRIQLREPEYQTATLDEDFTAKVVIFDNAGNSRTLPTQKFRYDNTLGEMTLWAVHDPNTSSSVVPGVSNYPAYKAGMVVNENPIRLVYRIPKI